MRTADQLARAAAYQLRWYRAHRDAELAKRRAARSANRDAVNAAKRRYYALHRAEDLARSAAWRAAHRDQKRARDRAYYQSHKANWARVTPEQKAKHVADSTRRFKADPQRAYAALRITRAKRPEHYRLIQVAGRERYIARKHGAPGSFTAAELVEKFALLGNCCLYCGRDDVKLEADHKIPLSRGGSNDIANIVPACRSCNARKCDHTAAEFLAEAAA